MKVSDFFLTQTIKDIRNKFKEVGLKKYNDVPESVEKWCEMFGLEQDEVITYMYVIKRFRSAEIYINFTLPNPYFPDCPIVFESEFLAQSGSSACKLSICRTMCYNEYVKVFKHKSDLFDDREKFNTIELDVFLCCLPDVSNEYVWGSRSKYTIKEGLTIWNVYESLLEFIKGLEPMSKDILKNIDEGMFEKVWNEIDPKNKFNTSNEQIKKVFFSTCLIKHYRAVKAGVSYKFEDFVKLYHFNTVHDLADIDGILSLASFDSEDKDCVKCFNEIMSFYGNN